MSYSVIWDVRGTSYRPRQDKVHDETLLSEAEKGLDGQEPAPASRGMKDMEKAKNPLTLNQTRIIPPASRSGGKRSYYPDFQATNNQRGRENTGKQSPDLLSCVAEVGQKTNKTGSFAEICRKSLQDQPALY